MGRVATEEGEEPEPLRGFAGGLWWRANTLLDAPSPAREKHNHRQQDDEDDDGDYVPHSACTLLRGIAPPNGTPGE